MIVINTRNLIEATIAVSFPAIRLGRYPGFGIELPEPLMEHIVDGTTIVSVASALWFGAGGDDLLAAGFLLAAVFGWGTLLILRRDLPWREADAQPMRPGRTDCLVFIALGLACALLHFLNWLPELNLWLWYALACLTVEYAVMTVAASIRPHDQLGKHGWYNLSIVYAWGFVIFAIVHLALAKTVLVALYVGMAAATIKAIHFHYEYGQKPSLGIRILRTPLVWICLVLAAMSDTPPPSALPVVMAKALLVVANGVAFIWLAKIGWTVFNSGKDDLPVMTQ